ncbi:histidine kinase [Emticicia sp. BO119]|uniref:histidine kinase n=1 Tax=Emticicia sp. BO119 TaxID=2757768 RepID=UPI0015F1243B|nr:histidine kinase [Emticicia sp. BO119]MBA4852844.1 histidine kinase [Emticicia sp. BO119]
MNYLPSEIKTVSAEGIRNVQIETITGGIELMGSDEDQIRIEIYASKRLFINFFRKESVTSAELGYELVNISQQNDYLRIAAHNNGFWRWDWLSFFQVSFRIFLPKNINAIMTTTVGDIALNNLIGKQTLRTAVGDVKIANSIGEIQGKASAGNIKIGNCDIKADLSTSGGNVLIQNSKGEINSNTSGGNFRLENFSGKLYTKTSGGNIKAFNISGEFKTFTFGGNIRLENMRGNISASTKGGNINIQATAINEYLWLETSGGNIKAQLPLSQGLQIEADGSNVRAPDLPNFQGNRRSGFILGSVNGGGASVKLKSFGGNVRIYAPKAELFPNVEDELKKKQYSWVDRMNVEKAPDASSRASVNETPTPIADTPRPHYRERNNSFRTSFKNAINRLNPQFVFYTLLFALFLIYGLNSILYFSLELLNPTSLEAEQNKAVFLANLTTGFSCFISLMIFILFIERFLMKNWSKYIILIVFTYCTLTLVRLFQKALYLVENDGGKYWTHYWRIMSVKYNETSISNHSTLYILIPMIAVCIIFYNWQRSKDLDRKISEQEYQLLNLEKLKTKAQLNALEARINPHFLYNSLNSITGLIHEDPDKAEDMTIQLSKLFRATTGRSDKSYHTIAEELDIVKSYLSIEQMRFGDRLKYSIHLESGLENIKIPRFLLQPIVENAIKHGISKITEHGIIDVRITKENNLVAFQIHDNGPAFKEDLSGGYGLRSISDKLQLIYGNDAHLQIENNDYKSIIIKVPVETLDKMSV